MKMARQQHSMLRTMDITPFGCIFHIGRYEKLLRLLQHAHGLRINLEFCRAACSGSRTSVKALDDVSAGPYSLQLSLARSRLERRVEETVSLVDGAKRTTSSARLLLLPSKALVFVLALPGSGNIGVSHRSIQHQQSKKLFRNGRLKKTQSKALPNPSGVHACSCHSRDSLCKMPPARSRLSTQSSLASRHRPRHF